MHPDSTKTDVAKAILQGLRSGQTNASDLPVATWKQVFWQRLQHLSLQNFMAWPSCPCPRYVLPMIPILSRRLLQQTW